MPFVNSGCSLKLTVFSLLFLCSPVLAEPVAPSAEKTNKQATADNQVDSFAIPKSVSNLNGLMAFIQETATQGPAKDQDPKAFQSKIARTVIAGVKKFTAGKLSNNLNDADATQATFLRLKALQVLQQMGEPKARETLTAAIEVAQADKRPNVQKVGTKFMIESGFLQWRNWNEEERTQLIDKIIQTATTKPVSGEQIELTLSVVAFLDEVNSEKHAQRLLKKTVLHIQSSKDPKIKPALTILQGIERGMNLLGNNIELDGSMLDGSELDWAAYRGKVVLVDYWATWCGPCRAEVPNVLKMYNAYHDKGFEVLGISLDEDPEQAATYIKQAQIPWRTMLPKDPKQRGWQHPMAVRYGITGIPRAILVDREGKVVHMSARGETLGKELRRLLGEPVARTKKRQGNSIQRVSNPPTNK